MRQQHAQDTRPPYTGQHTTAVAPTHVTYMQQQWQEWQWPADDSDTAAHVRTRTRTHTHRRFLTSQHHLIGPQAFSPSPAQPQLGGLPGDLLRRKPTPVWRPTPTPFLSLSPVVVKGSLRGLSVAPKPHEARQSRDPGGQVQHMDSERHGMGMLTYTAGAQDHRAARQSSHMQMGRREQ